MKRRVIVALMVAFSCAGAWAAQKPETLADLKIQAAAVAPDDCVRLCMGVARRALNDAKEQFEKGAYEEARGLLQDVTTYSDKAADAAIRSKKHEKQLEIDLRDLSHHLEILKHDVALEDEAAVEGAMKHIEKLRTRLLQSMFGKGKP